MALTHRRRAFIDEYLECWNASEAARRAGYSLKTAGSAGHELLKNPEIAQEISRRVADRAMSADETLIRMADKVRVSMADFIRLDENGNVQLDFTFANLNGKLHAIRKLKTRTRSYTGYVAITVGPDGPTVAISDTEDGHPVEITETEAEIELYNNLTALEMVGKTHGLFREAVDHVVRGQVNVTGDEMAAARAAAQEYERQLMDGDVDAGALGGDDE